jgi:hypothetical protein
MMEAVRTPETSVYLKESAWRCIMEGSHLHDSSDSVIKSEIFYIVAKSLS